MAVVSDGDFDLSASVKAYYALKLGRETTRRTRTCERAREAILAHGGAARASVFVSLASLCSSRCRGVRRPGFGQRRCSCRSGRRST